MVKGLESRLSMTEFTHLHLHTEYSLLDGACDVTKLVDRVAALGQTSVAMTDHGNIYGAVHFFDAAKQPSRTRVPAVPRPSRPMLRVRRHPP